MTHNPFANHPWDPTHFLIIRRTLGLFPRMSLQVLEHHRTENLIGKDFQSKKNLAVKFTVRMFYYYQ